MVGKDSAPTIASTAAAKVAERVFRQNPDIEEAFVTSDGFAFYRYNDAQNHANTLNNREVFGFKRGVSSQTVAPATPAPATDDASATASAISKNADGAEEIDELTGEPVTDERANTDEPETTDEPANTDE